MSWLESAFGLGDSTEPIAPPKPRLVPDVKYISVVVAQPSGAPGDLGETVDAWYFVEYGTVTMCDAAGKPSDHSATLAPNDDPRTAAYRLGQRIWQKDNKRSAFDRPLYQSPAGYGGY